MAGNPKVFEFTSAKNERLQLGKIAKRQLLKTSEQTLASSGNYILFFW